MKDYPNLTITFLIEYNNKFLIISRGKHEKNFPSLWAFPGGKVEIGETGIDTIKREILEEVGLEILDEAAFLNSYTFKKSVGIAFLIRAKSDEVKLSDEFDDYAWIESVEEMNSYKCISGIYNHLVRAKELLAKRHFDSLEKMNLTKEKYINV